MNIYSVVQVSKIGSPLRGAPTRKYRATSARAAGALYAAGQGLSNPRTNAHYAGNMTKPRIYTFNPAGRQGAPMRVLVTLMTTPESVTFTSPDDDDTIPEPCAACEANGWTALCDACKAHTLTFAADIKKEIG
jgi:hypothetical protein